MNGTGATKLVSYTEMRLETHEVRRSKHKVCLFYKMSNNISPDYLFSLVPQPVENTISYGLLDASDLNQPFSKTQLHYESFLPSSIRLWTNVPRNRERQTVLLG